jgi:uncharacterized membrane protein
MFTNEELDNYPVKNHFRLRGLPTTRLDTFVDAVFAFATTMLVISVGTIPKTYEELIIAIKGIPAFIASFAQVMFFWMGHRRWSRYYGVENGGTIFLSLTLIFMVLVYIYPLKLIFSAMFAWISKGWFPSEFLVTRVEELTGLFMIYGLGTFVLSGILAILFKKALMMKQALQLNRVEQLSTRYEMVSFLNIALAGLVSALFALVFPQRIAVFAGFVYVTLAISSPLISVYYSNKIDRLVKSGSN